MPRAAKGWLRGLLSRVANVSHTGDGPFVETPAAGQVGADGARIVRIPHSDGGVAASVEFSPVERPTIRLYQGSDGEALLNSLAAVWATMLSESDRRAFAAWTGEPLPWGERHDERFREALAHVAWESDAPAFESFRAVVPRPSVPTSPPLSPQARSVIERMIGA